MTRRSVDEVLEQARARLERLEPSEAYDAVRDGAVIIDTRSRDQRERDGSIPGALNHPLSVLEWRVDPASAHRDPAVGGLDARIIVVCAEGYSSSLAAARLQDLGFARATDVIGGFAAWAGAGLPVVR